MGSAGPRGAHNDSEAAGEGVTEEGTSSRTGDSAITDTVWQKTNYTGEWKGHEQRGLQSGSELAGAAGVALQEAYDGRVAFGPSDELLQGQLS